MPPSGRPAIIELDPTLMSAIAAKASSTGCTVEELVSRAILEALREDDEDLAAFDERAEEATISLDELVAHLKANGTI